ncbi:hypothetical protein [uncultured Tessaracoccus sp.]|uniref:hypothetical protein n=1 Tax=uncultured Tessaracoccus sp. TaxID=905023 RepID=UPI0025F3555C|nr:hypothetical protein [uncultured Tessaracoccus sp.]
MGTRRLVAAVAALLVCGCAETPPQPVPSPTATATATASTAAPLDPDHLPHAFTINGALLDGRNARLVQRVLTKVADGLPALKLDMTASTMTLTVLDGHRAIGYRWMNGTVDETTTDFQYFGQDTFDPEDFPLESVGTMFDVADLLGVQGKLVYQVQQYREQQVVQTVASQPESLTVFFRDDASAVPVLDVRTTADIAEGLASVVEDADAVVEFGFSAQRGYWARVPVEDGRELRTRKGGIPTFAVPDGGPADAPTFDPALIRPATIATALATRRSGEDDDCEVRVDAADGTPAMTIRCGGTTTRTDLAGKALPKRPGG